MNRSSTIFCCLCSFVFAFGLGLLFCSMQNPIPVKVKPVMTPPPATHAVDRDLVVGLSEVVADVHRELKQTETTLRRTRMEARQIINAMVREIEQLRERPSCNPCDCKSCDCGKTPTLASS